MLDPMEPIDTPAKKAHFISGVLRGIKYRGNYTDIDNVKSIESFVTYVNEFFDLANFEELTIASMAMRELVKDTECRGVTLRIQPYLTWTKNCVPYLFTDGKATGTFVPEIKAIIEKFKTYDDFVAETYPEKTV